MGLRSFSRIDASMLSVTVIWGLNFAVMKDAYAYFNPLAFAGLRFIIAVATLAVILRLRGVPLGIDLPEVPSIIGLALLHQTLYQILFVLGLAASNAGNAALLNSLTPIFAYIAGVCLKREQFSRPVLGGILVSFSGAVAIVLSGSNQIEFGSAVRGDLLLLASAFCWGWYTGGAARLAVKYGALRLTFWLLLVGTLMMIPFVLPFAWRQDWSAIPAKAWVEFAYSTFLSAVYSYLIWSHALEKLGVSGTAVYSNLTPLIALLGGWVILGEHPAAAQFSAVVLILLGVFMVRTHQARGPSRGPVVDRVRSA
jgi:drug/metabolite transporter (DMT)-like permease